MARRVLFILLSFVVFGSALSSGYSYIMTRQAANDYRQTLIEKARVGAIVEEANLKERRAKEGRQKAEKALKKLTDGYQNAKKTVAGLKEKIASLETNVEEFKAQKKDAEDALRSALTKSKTANKAKDSSASEIAALKEKLAVASDRQKEDKTALKKAKQDIAKEREAKNLAVKSRAEAEKNLYSAGKKLKEKTAELSGVVANLTEARSNNKKIKEELDSLQADLKSNSKGSKEANAQAANNTKELVRLQDELKVASLKLNEANETVQALKKTQENSVKKVSELAEKLKTTEATLLKKLEVAEKEAAAQKVIAAKAVEAAKKKTKVSKSVDNNRDRKKTVVAANVIETRTSATDNKDKNQKPEVQKQSDAEKNKSAKEASDKVKELEDRARLVQQELKRLGCYDGKVDGVWGQGSLDALVAFSKSANLARVRKYPTTRAIRILKSKTGTVCKVAGADNKDKKPEEAKKTSSATPPKQKFQTLREQCLASCVGAFESVRSCKANC